MGGFWARSTDLVKLFKSYNSSYEPYQVARICASSFCIGGCYGLLSRSFGQMEEQKPNRQLPKANENKPVMSE